MQKAQDFSPKRDVIKGTSPVYNSDNSELSEHMRPAHNNKGVSILFTNRVNGDSVRCFDLVKKTSGVSSAAQSQKTGMKTVGYSDKTTHDHLTWFNTFRAEHSFGTVKDSPPKLFNLLLFYLDQIVYLQEAVEKIEKLDSALSDQNLDRLNSTARECLVISLNAGMLALIEPLRQLEQMRQISQLTNLSALVALIKRELENYRFDLKANLRRAKVAGVCTN